MVTAQHNEPSFDEELCDLVAATAPRLFAVVQEYKPGTEDADGVVVAWGLAQGEDNVHVHPVGDDSGRVLTLRSTEGAVRLFPGGTDVRTRLVWLKPSREAALDLTQAA
jgi:hypothetical protein